MATAKKTAPQSISLRLDLLFRVLRVFVALRVLPAIYASAGYEIFEQEDGKVASRAVYLSFEVADAFIAKVSGAQQ